jgi:hypothetical protein
MVLRSYRIDTVPAEHSSLSGRWSLSPGKSFGSILSVERASETLDGFSGLESELDVPPCLWVTSSRLHGPSTEPQWLPSVGPSKQNHT